MEVVMGVKNLSCPRHVHGSKMASMEVPQTPMGADSFRGSTANFQDWASIEVTYLLPCIFPWKPRPYICRNVGQGGQTRSGEFYARTCWAGNHLALWRANIPIVSPRKVLCRRRVVYALLNISAWFPSYTCLCQFCFLENLSRPSMWKQERTQEEHENSNGHRVPPLRCIDYMSLPYGSVSTIFRQLIILLL